MAEVKVVKIRVLWKDYKTESFRVKTLFEGNWIGRWLRLTMLMLDLRPEESNDG